MKEKYKVTGMTCAACSSRVERAVMDVTGVEKCSVNLLTGDLTVEGSAKKADVCEAVQRAGYGISDDAVGEVKNESVDKDTLRLAIRLGVSLALCLVLMYIAMGHMVNLKLPRVLYEHPLINGYLQMTLSLAVMIINKRFFINGARGLIRRAANMDTLVSLGSFVSFAYSLYLLIVMSVSGHGDLLHGLYFESAAMILALITLGKMLEARAKGKTTDAIRRLIDLTPKTARVIKDGKEYEIPAESLRVGDVFIVKPGDSIPCDGVVISGASVVDESALTGESIPKEKNEGDSVYASSANKSGYITCRATAELGDTVLFGIIKMVKDATATKAPIAKLADRVSGVFVPVVLGLSLVTFVGWMIAAADMGYSIERAIAVLVISCPCALGLATPVAIMVGSGVGAKRGILYKTAAALEECGRIDTVVLDKTGTVTEGRMSVRSAVAFIDEDKLLSLVLGIERMSEHPIAEAIVRYTEERGAEPFEVTEFSNLEGRGVFGIYEGKKLFGVSLGYAEKLTEIDEETKKICKYEAERGRTPVLFILDGVCIGIFSLQDTLEKGAREGVRRLRSRGYRVVMLTGDNEVSARAIAESVGITEVIAGVLPNGKESVIRELMKTGRVCMVGDGINDAPALARANVGIAVGGGTDIAIDSADAVLMSGGITEAAYALDIGRATLKNIKENLFFAFLYNCIGIPLAAGVFGISMPPMFGALAMSLSSVSVVSNALRLNLWRPKQLKSDNEESTKEKITVIKSEEKELEMAKEVKEYKVSGMMCPHCEARVKSVVEALSAVESAIPSHTEKKLTVTFVSSADDSAVIKAVTDAGYSIEA